MIHVERQPEPQGFHEYLARQLADHLKKRRVVVWYDPNEELAPFVAELPRVDGDGDLPGVQLGEMSATLAQFEGSFFGLRSAVEPLVAVDQPEPLLIYLPGVARDREASPLMELEKAGTCYEPQLKRLARNVLRETHTDGVIDELLTPEKLSYQDVVGFLAQGGSGQAPSMLKVVFAGCRDSTGLMAAWLADSSCDDELTEKQAAEELFTLLGTRLGVEVDSQADLATARDKAARHVLVNEFRADLTCDAPASLSMIPEPSSSDRLDRLRAVADRLRSDYADSYVALANRVESELSLSKEGLDATHLGSTDTFQFEERLLLSHCDSLISAAEYDEALEVITGRRRSFWVDRDVARQAQWEACRLMAELGLQVEAARSGLDAVGSDPAKWVEAYTAPDGWHRADQLQRQLEAWVAKMDDDPEAEAALGMVRSAHEKLLEQMAEGFTQALRDATWTVAGVLAQTQVYSESVKPAEGRVVYFLVDALRYEMGVELSRQLQAAEDLVVRPAIAAPPTLTPIGMAALLPGAASSFSVGKEKGTLAALVSGKPLRNTNDRTKLLKAEVPEAIDLTLGKALQSSSAQLRRAIGESPLIVVRSQEIDALGESGDDFLARQVMDTAIGNVARAIRKLAELGIERFVVAADHGYQFSVRKGDDMKTDSPDGDTVEIHRRCWIGRGGQTPPGTVRVAGAELGYDTDLDFVFPTGLGVLPAHGGLSYHHGGLSLQELVVPVLSFRLPATAEEQKGGPEVELTECPEAITNRTFGVVVGVGAHLFAEETVSLKVVLISDGEEVGKAGMAVDAEVDASTGIVQATPGKKASIGVMLVRDDCEALRVVVQDPKTDAVLAQSDELPVRLMK